MPIHRSSPVSLTLRASRGLVAVAALIALAAACATTAEDEAKGPPRKVYYVLRRGPVHASARPLADATDILIEWHYSDGSTTKAVGFRGWDMDGDGRFEMVEVLDASGNVTKRVLDFDGDGRIDMVRGVDE